MGSVQVLVCRTFLGESAVHRVRTISLIPKSGMRRFLRDCVEVNGTIVRVPGDREGNMLLGRSGRITRRKVHPTATL